MKKAERKNFDDLFESFDGRYGNPMQMLDQIKGETKAEIMEWIKNLTELRADLVKRDETLEAMGEYGKDRRATCVLKLNDGKKVILNADELNGHIIGLRVFFDIWSGANGIEKKI